MKVCLQQSSAESHQARQFTLFHEYGHILLRTSGICNESEDVDERPDERWFYQFAAAVLMPRELVVSLAEVIAGRSLATWVSEDVERLARRLKVGRPAMAIRLEELGFLREGEAGRHISEWDEEWSADVWTEQPDSEESPSELRIPMALRRVSTLGASLPTLVFQGLDSGILEQRDASLLLDTGIKHFPAIRELLAQRRAAYA